MICDKCGFEHNSRSVCPKCGARVVYVNEDYLRRRREWEEAEKKGGSAGLPPGIIHSTREDYDRRNGRDAAAGKKEESGHGEARSPFDDLKEQIKFVRDKLVSFWRRRKKRRGADNPVIREIHFDGEQDAQEEIPEPELVPLRRHSVKRKRPGVIAAAAVLLLLAAGACAAFISHFSKDGDRSRVFVYDGKYGYYAGEENNRLLGDGSEGAVFFRGENSFAACGENHVYAYSAGEIRSAEAVRPRIIAYNGSMSLVVYEAGDGVCILSGEGNNRLELDKKGDFTSACAVSGNGKYFALTECVDSGDFTTGKYTLYMGEADGSLFRVSEDDNDKELISVCDDGRLVFSDMATADYGIINGRSLKVWDFESGEMRVIADNVYGLRYDGTGSAAYYMDAGGGLYRWGISDGSTELLDTGVAALCANPLYGGRGGVLYRKETGFFLCEDGKKPQFLFDGSAASPEFYFDYSRDCLYYRDMGTLYYVKLDGGSAPERVCPLKDTESVICCPAGNFFAALDSDGTLWELEASPRQLASDVSCVCAVENTDGYAYCSGGRLIYSPSGKKQVTLAEDTDSADSMIFSGGKIYYRTADGILHRVSPDGSGMENLGYAERIIAVEK